MSELYREGTLVYKVLTPEHRDTTAAVLARAFCTEPTCEAVGEIRPDMKATILDWFEFAEFWMDHCSTNGLSIVVIDEKNHRIAGGFLVRDLLFFPKEFLDNYKNDKKPLAPLVHFLSHLDNEAQKVFPLLTEMKVGDACDFWFLGVHSDYRGMKIANHLMHLAILLATKAGFQFATIEATNAFTSKAAALSNFRPLVQIEVKTLLWENGPFYTNTPLPHGTWTFWLKELQETETNKLSSAPLTT